MLVHVCVYVCVCVCVCDCVCVCVHMCVYVCVRECVCVSLCIFVRVYLYEYKPAFFGHIYVFQLFVYQKAKQMNLFLIQKQLVFIAVWPQKPFSATSPVKQCSVLRSYLCVWQSIYYSSKNNLFLGIYMSEYVHICLLKYVHTSYIYVSVYICIHMYVYMYVYTYENIYTYIYPYAYHMHIYR